MLALLISIAVSVAAVIACNSGHVNKGTTIFAGIAGLLATYYLVGWLVRKRITAVQKELQEILQRGQQRMSRKIQQFQSKPGADVRLLQRQIEGDQKAVIKEALDFIPRLERFRKWNFLMGRQMTTMRFQFLYQLKEFEKVDEILFAKGLFKGPLLMEPMTVAMKMARQYKNGDEAGAEKTFKKKVKWFRGEKGTLLYALMSWILVKQGKPEEARQLLQKAKDTTYNETLAFNWERLSNNKEKSFSNAGLGDEWFGLYLENPPAPRQQRVRSGKGHRPF